MSRKSSVLKLLFATTAMTLIATAVFAQSAPVTVVGFGGSYQAAQKKALFEPASKKINIPFKEDTGGELAQIRAQVKSGSVSWDIASPGGYDCVVGAKEGLFEPLDYKIIDAKGIDPKLVQPYWIANDYYSIVLAWSTTKYGANPPKSWADYFDVEKFPGRRALPGRPEGTLELALLADGVAPDKLYPLDTDRAFKKLSSLGKNLTAFWKLGGQSVQLVKDGEVDMIGMFNGRVMPAIADGVKIGFTFNQGVLQYSCWMIPKGSKNAVSAMKFINEFKKPDPMAEFAKMVPYGPAQLAAYDPARMPTETARQLPSSPENLKLQVLQDNDYWLANKARVQELWDKWLQSR